MKINLNNVRKQLVYAHDRLVNKLNIMTKDSQISGGVDEIKNEMGELRQLIAAVAFSYIPDEPELRDLSNEIDNLAEFDPEV